MDITLNDLLQIKDADLKDWTICLNIPADYGDTYFYYFTGDPNSEQDKRVMQHISWRKGVKDKNAFRNIDTKYCLQFIGRKGTSDQWLFLGAYEIDPNKRIFFDKDGNERYNLIEMDLYSGLKERLFIEYKKIKGPKQAKLPASHVNSIKVVEVLDDMLRNKVGSFESYSNVCLSFLELKQIVEKQNVEWRQALDNVYGVYVITDLKTHKHYIGAAYGDKGFWNRWCYYVATGGHGGDKKLKEVVARETNYAEKYFQFAIIEATTNSDQKYVTGRETYWKGVFDTREGGYNNN